MVKDRERLARTRGRVKRIVVNKHHLRANKKDGGDRPIWSIQTSAGPIPAHKVFIQGKSESKNNIDKPLSCGATAWIETTEVVEWR